MTIEAIALAKAESDPTVKVRYATGNLILLKQLDFGTTGAMSYTSWTAVATSLYSCDAADLEPPTAPIGTTLVAKFYAMMLCSVAGSTCHTHLYDITGAAEISGTDLSYTSAANYDTACKESGEITIPASGHRIRAESMRSGGSGTYNILACGLRYYAKVN